MYIKMTGVTLEEEKLNEGAATVTDTIIDAYEACGVDNCITMKKGTTYLTWLSLQDQPTTTTHETLIKAILHPEDYTVTRASDEWMESLIYCDQLWATDKRDGYKGSWLIGGDEYFWSDEEEEESDNEMMKTPELPPELTRQNAMAPKKLKLYCNPEDEAIWGDEIPGNQMAYNWHKDDENSLTPHALDF